MNDADTPNDGRQWLRSELERTLGAPIRKFVPNYAESVAGLILGIAAVCGASALAYAAVMKTAGGVSPIGILVALLVLLFGVMCFWMGMAGWKAGAKVFVCPHGFWYEAQNRNEPFPWDQIERVDETVRIVRMYGLKSKIIFGSSRTFREFDVVRRDGHKFGIAHTFVRASDELGELLRHEAEQRSIPWTTSEVHV
ncbi:MAG: hypothetical protein WD648_10430 [Planctomycetaceae bacterium]